MPSFSTEVPHNLGQQAAKERLEGFLKQIEQQYKGQIGEVDGGWDGYVLNYAFSTFGIAIKGKLAIEENKVVLDGEIPLSAMMFKGKITGGVKDALEKALA